MLNLNPQFIKDDLGNNTFVVFSANEYEVLMETLEDLEDNRLFDEAINDKTALFVNLDEVKLEMEL